MRFQASIRTRIISLVSLSLILASVVGGFSLYEMGRIRSEIQEIAQTDLPLTELITRIENLQLQEGVQVERAFRYGIAGNAKRVASIHQQLSRTSVEIGKVLAQGVTITKQAVATASTPEAGALFQEVHDSFIQLQAGHDRFNRLVRKTLADVKAGRASQAQDAFLDIEEMETGLIREQDRILHELEALLEQTARHAVQEEEQGIFFLGLLLAASMTISLFLSWGFSKDIIKPLAQAAAIADDISENRLDIKAPQGHLPEMKRLFGAMTHMAEAIKEHNRLEHLLMMSEKMSSIGRLTAGIAHEINNPLASASMGAQTLKTLLGPQPPAEVAKRIASIERNLDRAASIAREMLVFSRTETGDFAPVDMQEQIEGALTLLSHKLKGVTVIQEWGNIPEVCGDFVRLEQAFINILSNAVDALEEGGEIRIFGTRDEEGAVMRISDNGHGIPEEIQSKIFDPFFTTKEVGLGTGLGLSISYNAILEHHGSIEMSSEVGRGTTFIVRLPARGETC